MKIKLLASLAGVLALVALMAPIAQAITIMNLDCEITGSGTSCTPGGPWGTLKITENASDANKVDITIDLVGTQNKILEFYLSYDESKFAGTPAFAMTSGGSTVDVYVGKTNKPPAFNDVEFSPYSLGFDLSSKPLSPDPFTGTLSLSGVNLNPEDFVFPAAGSGLYAGVHIGDYGGSPGVGGGDSIKVGADSPDQTSNVPEPTSIFIAGSGLLWLVGLLRRKNLLNL